MDIFLDKSTIEFLTVATEFCAFVEKTSKFSRADYLNKMHKLLSLVYLKATLLQPDDNSDFEGEAEAFLSEYEYEYIKGMVSQKLGVCDSYINVYNSASNDSAYEQAEISECVADVYHNLKNFVENCRTVSEECASASRIELINDFKDYWGFRALSLLSAIHSLVYTVDLREEADDDDSEEESEERNSGGFLNDFMENYHKKL